MVRLGLGLEAVVDVQWNGALAEREQYSFGRWMES